MLTITLSATDQFPEVELTMEHSLLSLSKWEAVNEKAFFGREDKTAEEMLQYIKYMLLTENPPPDFLERLTPSDYKKISDYMTSNQSATKVLQDAKKGPSETVTSDLMYYWLVQFQIPFHPTETWHVNRLFTLVGICGRKQEKPKKVSPQQIAAKYRELNEQRRRDMGTKG